MLQLDANLVQGLFILYAILLFAGVIAFANEVCAYWVLSGGVFSAGLNPRELNDRGNLSGGLLRLGIAR